MMDLDFKKMIEAAVDEDLLEEAVAEQIAGLIDYEELAEAITDKIDISEILINDILGLSRL